MGPMEDAVQAQLAEWGADGALAALCVTLARELDGDRRCKECGGAVVVQASTAAIARELRTTLLELAPKVDDDADIAAALVAGLSSPVEHSKN